ncbi:unnamed protein product, partial [Brassica napus]
MKRVLGLKEGLLPASDSRIGLESSSTGSSFPADSAKPVPLAVVSLDSRRGHRIPLSVPVLSWLFDARESSRKSRSQSVPGRHEAVRSRHVSSSSSPPTVDGGCSPWRPDAVMSTTGCERLFGPPDFQGPPRMHRTPRDVRCSSSRWTLPPAEPFQVRRTICPSVSLRDSTRVSSGFAPSGIVHHLSGPDRHAHTRTLLGRSRSVGCAPVRDSANQLPCALRFYSPVDSHMSDSLVRVSRRVEWGSPQAGAPSTQMPRHAREVRAADHD